MNALQQKSSQNLNEIIPGFGERLKLAFDNASNAHIARVLGVAPSAVTNYMNDRVPKLALLFKICEAQGCSLDWLLTGKGMIRPAPRSALFVNLTDEEHVIIRERAAWLKIAPEELVAEYIRQGLEQNQMLPYPPVGEQLIEVPLYETIEELPSDKLGDAFKQFLDDLKRRASA